MKKWILSIVLNALCVVISLLHAQEPLQKIRGRVIDRESQYPIIGATVKVLKGEQLEGGAVSDVEGYFRLNDIPVGRYTLWIEYLGYEKVVMDNVIVTTGKETLLQIEMTEKVQELKGAVIKGTGVFETVNELGVVSNRAFNSEETERYAGSRQDPARMALNFAGAQATDDSRNDIIVRGNSPLGLLWRYEDVELFNPNHFAVAGSTGGPISMLNNKVIGRSDFMTGAFPSGYGNALSGVFDIRMRNGNNEKHEKTFQFGIFGTELSVEGPLSKQQKSSYLVAYRYSTLKLFESLKFNLGTNAVPNYQDLTFKVNIPTKKSGTFTLFGLGGTSKIAIVMSNYTEPQTELYGRKDRDQYFATSMAMVGASHKIHINKTTVSKITFSVSGSDIGSQHDLVLRNADYSVQRLVPKLAYSMRENKASLAWSLRKKVSAKHSYVTGFYADMFYFNYSDSLYNENTDVWKVRMNFRGHENATMLQPYFQWNTKVNDRLLFTAGVHGTYFALSNSGAIEPRAGLKWNMSPTETLSFGYGLHSRAQPYYVYFSGNITSGPIGDLPNKNMGLTKSHHLVASYDKSFSKVFRMKAETYYQHLFNVPVEALQPSSFSLLNMGSGFDRFFPSQLTNTGTGTNYGAELTLERSFFKEYFLLLTGSLFESTYKGSDGIQRNTDFNGRFATRCMIGGEKAILKNKRTKFAYGLGVTYAGGRRYSPVDEAASLLEADAVFVDSLRNTLQFKNFFRTDLRVGFKKDAKKVTHEFMLDIINVFNTRNILTLSYDPDIPLTQPGKSPLREEPQLGLLPVFFYKIHF